MRQRFMAIKLFLGWALAGSTFLATPTMATPFTTTTTTAWRQFEHECGENGRLVLEWRTVTNSLWGSSMASSSSAVDSSSPFEDPPMLRALSHRCAELLRLLMGAGEDAFFIERVIVDEPVLAELPLEANAGLGAIDWTKIRRVSGRHIVSLLQHPDLSLFELVQSLVDVELDEPIADAERWQAVLYVLAQMPHLRSLRLLSFGAADLPMAAIGTHLPGLQSVMVHVVQPPTIDVAIRLCRQMVPEPETYLQRAALCFYPGTAQVDLGAWVAVLKHSLRSRTDLVSFSVHLLSNRRIRVKMRYAMGIRRVSVESAESTIEGNDELAAEQAEIPTTLHHSGSLVSMRSDTTHQPLPSRSGSGELLSEVRIPEAIFTAPETVGRLKSLLFRHFMEELQASAAALPPGAAHIFPGSAP